MKLSVFSTVFAVAFAVVYLLAVEQNYALFTYHPALGEFDLGVKPARDGPAMYWYGWLVTSGIIAFVLAVVASILPQRTIERITPNLGWAVPLAAILGFGWMLRGYFLVS